MFGVVITDATQGLGIALFGIKAAESNRLIAPLALGRADRTALDHVKFQVGFAVARNARAFPKWSTPKNICKNLFK
jgi:hypothetical protein